MTILFNNDLIQTTPITGRIGALVEGIQLSGDLSAATVAALNQALLNHKVLFFKQQHHLNDAEQERFAALLGRPVKHPTVPSAQGTDYVFELDSDKGLRANSWHTDVTFLDSYPKISILRGVTIPPTGGDTTWANTETAYEDLPNALKNFAEQISAIHSNQFDYIAPKAEVSEESLDRFRKVFSSIKYETEHPVVIVHPETGKKSLLLGHFIKKFVGFDPSETQQIFNLLQARVLRPENTVRWRWQEGDVVIWDNRSTQHYAVNDYGTERRIVHRVTLAGEVTVGVNGKTGRIISPQHLPEDQLESAKIQAALNS
jgi:alpha-ketoglutarate-dependent taurine dioxygenase